MSSPHATTRLPLALYRAEELRHMDALAIDGHGIPGGELMARAGGAAFNTLRSRWPAARRLLVCCGGGNNGGDGYVIAALARRHGLAAEVVALGDPSNLQGDALAAYEEARAAGVAVTGYGGGLPAADVVVDALFGTGLDRRVTGAWEEAIRAVNGCSRPVLAVDIPSGLHADSGRVLGGAVRADVTVTFIGLKRGLFTAEGPEHAGAVAYHDLAVPPAVLAGVAAGARRLEQGGVRGLLGRRPRNAHKGDCGHVLVVGGDAGMAGAPRMAGLAALRAGAGLVSVAAAPGAANGGGPPELMVHAVSSARGLEPLLDKADVVALGPGLGTGDWGRQMFQACQESGRPLVVDADGLNLLAFEGGSREDRVLTPHPGEAGRLLGTAAADVQADRFVAVAELRRRYGGSVVLKGCGTLVSGPVGPVEVCASGNPGMASGGMGDVLTGVIAGLAAQGLDLQDAARAGAWVHGAAADRLARRGERGLLATDLLAAIHSEVNP